MRCSIGIASDYRVIGHNPENADLDHPRGEVVAGVFYLLATDAQGNRWAWGSFLSEETAQAAIADAPPVVLWGETYPEYGSPAFVRYGEEDLIAWEGRHVDAEFLADPFYVA